MRTARELRRALDWAAATPVILFRRDDAARQLWQGCYPSLSQLRPGLRGAAITGPRMLPWDGPSGCWRLAPQRAY